MDIKDLYHLYRNHPIICTDTRTIVQQSIFFALKGENYNANEYAQQALEKGAVFAVIDDGAYKKDERYIVVENTLKTLQDLAAYHRQQLHIPVIGITGSNGKTTTKELIAQVLQQKYRIHATKGNLNNHIGVPLTLLSIPSTTEIVIVEMGANHKGEIEQLCQIAQPNYGIITNIGKAHLEGFGGIEGVIQGKTELYQHIKKTNGTLFVHFDNPILKEKSYGINRITYGKDDFNYCSGELLESNPFATLLWNKTHHIHSHLIGGYNAENILASICIGLFFKVSEENIKQAIATYRPSNNRSQYLETGKNKLVLDAYNANPTSVSEAIKNFAVLDLSNKYIILGDMLEVGEATEKEHQEIIDLIQMNGFTQVLLVGQIYTQLNTSFPSFNDVQMAYNWIQEHPIQQATILLKGSRGVHLEQLIDLF